MSTFSFKKQQFTNYLSENGVIKALSKALADLYETKDRPDNAIVFLRRRLCKSCPTDEDYANIKNRYEVALKQIAELEKKITTLKNEESLTPSQMMLNMNRKYDEVMKRSDKDFLFNKLLKLKVFNQLKGLKTEGNATLYHCIQGGLEMPESTAPIFAADAECYTLFRKIFEPAIIKYHGLSSGSGIRQEEHSWGDPKTIKNVDPDGTYVECMKLTLKRNLVGYNFFPLMTEEDFIATATEVATALKELTGEYWGEFRWIESLDVDDTEELMKSHMLFDRKDKEKDASGGYRFWPTGRGVYYNPAKTFYVWVNFEDHLTITSLSRTGSLGEIYSRLMGVMPILEEKLKFQRNDKLGYITVNPANIGTTLTVFVHINLPKLSQDKAQLKEVIKKVGLVARALGPGGLGDKQVALMNKKKIGLTEYDIVKKIQDDVLEILKAETTYKPASASIALDSIIKSTTSTKADQSTPISTSASATASATASKAASKAASKTGV